MAGLVKKDYDCPFGDEMHIDPIMVGWLISICVLAAWNSWRGK
jgi:hypothetical protein